jgi:signal transduction histidine kinase
MNRFAGMMYRLCILLLVIFVAEAEAQRTITTTSGGVLRAFSPEDGIAGYTPNNAGLTADGFIWFSTRAGTVRINPAQIEDFGQEYGIHMMPFTYHDRVNEVTWFTDYQELVRLDENGFTRYTAEDGFLPPGPDNRTIMAMHGDREGRLWIGSLTMPADEPHNGGLMVYENGTIRVFDRDEFPLHNVSGIFESSDGYLWFTSIGYISDGVFASESNIARFDGADFEVFDSETTGCRNVMINFMGASGIGPHIVEDGEGRLWITCNGSFSAEINQMEYSGLFVYENGRIRPVDEFNDQNVRPFPLYVSGLDALFLDLSGDQSAGNIATGYPVDEVNRKLVKYDAGEWIPVPFADTDFLVEITATAGYTNAKYNSINVLDGSDGQIYLVLAGFIESTNSFFSHFFVYDDDDFSYVDTVPGVILLELPGRSFVTVLNEPDILGLYSLPRSRLLTETDGLLRNPSNGGQLTTDRDGNVWISLSNQYDADEDRWNDAGINMWDGSRLHAYTTGDGLTSNFAYRPYHASDGRLWIPTNRGVTLGEKNDDEYTFTPVPVPDNRPYWVSEVLEAEDGTIWAYNQEARPEMNGMEARPVFFGRYSNGSFEKVENPFSDSLKALPYQVYEMKNGSGNRIWLYGRFSENQNTVNRNTFIRMYENGSWSDPAETLEVPQTRLYFVGELNDNRYYIINGGFLKFDGERYIDLSDSVTARADYRILKQVETQGMAFNIEGNGYLYIRLRDRGFVVYDGENLTYLDRRSGLPSVRLLFPNKDRNGEMMFTTAVGGAVFNGTDYTFFRDDAIPNNTPNGIGRDKYGNMLILYQNAGITVTRMDTVAYPVRFTQITSDTLTFFGGRQPDLPYSQNRIGFQFASMNFSGSDEARFRYKLEGYHNDWMPLTRQNEVQFSDLRPGSYTFRVQAVVSGSEASEDAVFSFRVLRPWWRQWWAYSLYLLLIAGAIFAADRIQRRRLRAIMREKTRARELEQAREIQKAYDELAKAHENLKAAQDQLVQQEKLASLGQLTAGIAHEIKNPLNFVNNFSEVSMELIREAKEEINGLDGKANFVQEILNDIESNLTKIFDHGSRADRIVRSMLLHSRGGSGKVEPADLNSLVREYVNLSYHGMRAGKDPITADIVFDTDDNIGDVNLIAEDFSRVILNISANAFDAMRTKMATTGDSDTSYSPVLTIHTRKSGDKAVIEIGDNGPGIPDEIRNKILQPFFTTKKGTEGTGLGLSITHDIIKAHGGELQIESGVGKGTRFIISLPLHAPGQ